jgi:putative heme transporter
VVTGVAAPTTGGEHVGRFEQVRDNLRRAYEAGRASVRAARDEARAAEDDGPPTPTNHAARNASPPDPAAPSGDEPTPAAAAPTPVAGVPTPVAGVPTPAVSAPSVAKPAAARPAIVVASTAVSHRDDLDVPRGLRVAGAWAWRILLLVLAGAGVLWVIAQLQLVIVPLIIAMLLSALLSPIVGWLRRHHVHRSLATALVVIGGIATMVGVLTLVVNEFIAGSAQLSENAAAGLNQIQASLHLTDKQVDSLVNSVEDWLHNNRGKLTSGALTTAATLGHVLAGIFLVLFATFFFLRDGRYITRFLVGLLPEPVRDPIASAADVSWHTLVAYVRATVLVAFIDAVGIGLWLVILKVPFWLPLAALVFLGAFVPIVGATLSGAVAVLVALVTRNPFIALLVLTGVIAVQQLEGHVLQPLIMGRAVAIHPLAVIVAIATGVVLAGIVGALVAVPVVAVLNTGIRHLAELRRAEETGGPPPGPPMPTGPPQPGAAVAGLAPVPPGVDF